MSKEVKVCHARNLLEGKNCQNCGKKAICHSNLKEQVGTCARWKPIFEWPKGSIHVNWTLSAEQDLKSFMDTNVEDELINAVSEEMKRALDEEIMRNYNK